MAENLFWQFERCGVSVLIADMPNYNSHDRREVLIRQIREAIAEDNRKEIIERLLKGRQERVRKGHSPGGNVPYGYRREGKILVKDINEIGAVRTILDGEKRGYKVADIVLDLNSQRLTRRNGKPWTQRQVRAIMARRDFYRLGKLRYGSAEGTNEQFILADELAS